MGVTKPFDCSSVTYQTATLNDFIYTHKCFPAGWEKFLEKEEVKDDINEISALLEVDARKNVIEPPMTDMFKAFTVSPDRIKAIIIGQDPTPQAGKATGLAFSLKPTEDPRDVPSVINMLVELKLEGMPVSLTNGDLTPWLKEGVLLLNAALTVIQGKAGSHQNYWSEFTRMLVEHLNDPKIKACQPSAWILWGGHANAYSGNIDKKKHYVKLGGHPSPIGGRKIIFLAETISVVLMSF